MYISVFVNTLYYGLIVKGDMFYEENSNSTGYIMCR